MKLNAEEKAALQNKYASQLSEAEKNTNIPARERFAKLEESLKSVDDEMKNNINNRRSELADNTQRTKNIASRQSNIAAALA
jgi:hypothetical protein